MRRYLGPLVSTLALTFAVVGAPGCAASASYEGATLTSPPAPPPPALGGSAGVGMDDDDEFAALPASADEEFEDTDPSAMTDFKPSLDPYGTWVDDPTYGTVWQPSPDVVGADFAPYVSNGQWALDDEDNWVWQSDYDDRFGWVTFHYGRWVYSGGWVWIPGRRYAPAWVTWRVGEPGYEYIGWAPMPPYYYWRGGAVVWLDTYPAAPFVFCSTAVVFNAHVGGYIVGRDRVGVIGGATHPYGPVGGHNFATPHPGPARTSGYVPAASYPSGHVSASPAHRSFQTPAGMGRPASAARRPNFADGRRPGATGTQRGFAGSPTRGLGSPQSHQLSSRATYDGSHAAAAAPAYAHSSRMASPSYGSRPSPSYGGSYHSSSSFHSPSSSFGHSPSFGGSHSYGGGSFGGGSHTSSRPSHSSGGHGGHR